MKKNLEKFIELLLEKGDDALSYVKYFSLTFDELVVAYEKANLSFTCKLNECNLYLEDGVTLPCGYTICKYHLNPFDQT